MKGFLVCFARFVVKYSGTIIAFYSFRPRKITDQEMNMWGCNYIGSGMGHWVFGGGIIGFGITVLILALIGLVFIQLYKSGKNRTQYSDTMDSLKILKTRFAKGEITEQEYRKMQDILCNNDTSK
jgi:putative membrane protein